MARLFTTSNKIDIWHGNTRSPLRKSISSSKRNLLPLRNNSTAKNISAAVTMAINQSKTHYFGKLQLCAVLACNDARWYVRIYRERQLEGGDIETITG